MSLKKGKNRDYTVKVFARADHGLWELPEDTKLDWDRPSPGWLDTMTDWLIKRTHVGK